VVFDPPPQPSLKTATHAKAQKQDSKRERLDIGPREFEIAVWSQ
jgi:hypothetical protein